MLSFTQFLICEQEEEQVTSTLKLHIRRVLELLLQASTLPDSSFEDRVAKQGNVLSELDLLEALDIVREVVKGRLTSKEVNIQGSQVKLGHEEWTGDKKAGYRRLFGSIRSEVKEALRLNFKRTGHEGLTFLMTHFTRQVVDPILDILQKVGPQQASAEVDNLVHEAGDHIKNMTRRFHSDDAGVAKKLLIAHDKLTTQLQKKAKPTKDDRYRIIKKVAQRFAKKE